MLIKVRSCFTHSYHWDRGTYKDSTIRSTTVTFFSSFILFEPEFLFRIPMRPSAAFCALRSARDTHGNMFFISYLTIHQFSHNHGKLKYSSYYLCSLGNFFCYNHILCLLFNLQLRNCEDILQQQAASRDVYFVGESLEAQLSSPERGSSSESDSEPERDISNSFPFHLWMQRIP